MSPEQDTQIESLYRAYFRRLTLYAQSALRDPDRAEEVVQDAFHEAVLHIDALMAHPNPGGWLMQAVKHKIQESERARRRYMLRFLSLDTALPVEPVTPEDSPEASGTDEASPMEMIRQSLTPEEFQLLKRIVFDRATHLEVSQELGISLYASQKRMLRIREKLYKLFPERKKKK